MAFAMILWYQPDLRLTQQRLWDELNYSGQATFHCDLHLHVLERRLKKGHTLSPGRNRNGWPKHSTSSRRALDGLRCVVACSLPRRLQLRFHGVHGRPKGGGDSSKKRCAYYPVKANQGSRYISHDILYGIYYGLFTFSYTHAVLFQFCILHFDITYYFNYAH
jgi:hypothetical protein